MTIAAGFRYRHGILLATDTQHTYSKMLKLSRPKLVPLEFADAKVGIAIAGNVDFALMATEKISAKLSETEATHAKIKEAIEDILLDVYQKHIYPSGGMFYENAFDLLIAVWTKKEGLKLLQTSNTGVTEIPNYGFSGIGLYLAQYLSKEYQADTTSQDEAYIFALDILQKVKDNVDGCGGDTQVLFLEDSGEWKSALPMDVVKIEAFVKTFGDFADSIAKICADLSIEENELDDFFETIKPEIHGLREEERRRREKFKKVFGKLGEIKTKKSQKI